VCFLANFFVALPERPEGSGVLRSPLESDRD
jgi:hypothetical protein